MHRSAKESRESSATLNSPVAETEEKPFQPRPPQATPATTRESSTLMSSPGSPSRRCPLCIKSNEKLLEEMNAHLETTNLLTAMQREAIAERKRLETKLVEDENKYKQVIERLERAVEDFCQTPAVSCPHESSISEAIRWRMRQVARLRNDAMGESEDESNDDDEIHVGEYAALDYVEKNESNPDSRFSRSWTYDISADINEKIDGAAALPRVDLLDLLHELNHAREASAIQALERLEVETTKYNEAARNWALKTCAASYRRAARRQCARGWEAWVATIRSMATKRLTDLSEVLKKKLLLRMAGAGQAQVRRTKHQVMAIWTAMVVAERRRDALEAHVRSQLQGVLLRTANGQVRAVWLKWTQCVHKHVILDIRDSRRKARINLIAGRQLQRDRLRAFNSWKAFLMGCRAEESRKTLVGSKLEGMMIRMRSMCLKKAWDIRKNANASWGLLMVRVQNILLHQKAMKQYKSFRQWLAYTQLSRDQESLTREVESHIRACLLRLCRGGLTKAWLQWTSHTLQETFARKSKATLQEALKQLEARHNVHHSKLTDTHLEECRIRERNEASGRLLLKQAHENEVKDQKKEHEALIAALEEKHRAEKLSSIQQFDEKFRALEMENSLRIQKLRVQESEDLVRMRAHAAAGMVTRAGAAREKSILRALRRWSNTIRLLRDGDRRERERREAQANTWSMVRKSMIWGTRALWRSVVAAITRRIAATFSVWKNFLWSERLVAAESQYAEELQHTANQHAEKMDAIGRCLAPRIGSGRRDRNSRPLAWGQ